MILGSRDAISILASIPRPAVSLPSLDIPALSHGANSSLRRSCSAPFLRPSGLSVSSSVVHRIKPKPRSHDITPPVHRQLPLSPQRATNGQQLNPAPTAYTLVMDAAQFEIDLRLCPGPAGWLKKASKLIATARPGRPKTRPARQPMTAHTSLISTFDKSSCIRA